jgi:acyl-coenzyme A thioesterase PaaI-like protein
MIPLIVAFAVLALPVLDLLICALRALRAGNRPLFIWNQVIGQQTWLISRFRPQVFGFLLGQVNPYSRSLHGFRMVSLQRGKAIGELRETKSVRNPFRSIHAAALVLLGETVGGLAIFSELEHYPQIRAIVKQLSCEYYQKSRGRVVASCEFQLPTEMKKLLETSSAKQQQLIDCQVPIIDAKSGEKVALLTVRWALSF